MSLVYAGVLSHAPGITGRAHMVENVEKRDELYRSLDRQRRDIEATGAEALVVVAGEHFGNFFHEQHARLLHGGRRGRTTGPSRVPIGWVSRSRRFQALRIWEAASFEKS